jgi:two-component system, NarL family, nitrate/nitrite response regulator NarL
MSWASVVIADRHPVVLEGLANVLRDQGDFKLVGCCIDANCLMETIRTLRPDIAIVDGSMPDLTKLQVLAMINSENLATRLVVFTASVEERELRILSGSDPVSIIPKEVVPSVLVQCLRRVADGQKLLPDSVSVLASHQTGIDAVAESLLFGLTERERQIVRLVSEGLSNKEIGRRLNIANGTIKVHLHNIYQKLEISNRTLLATFAISHDASVGQEAKTNFSVIGAVQQRHANKSGI